MERTIATSECSRWSPAGGISVSSAVEPSRQLPLGLAALRRDQFHARQQELEVGRHGVDHARGRKHLRLLQHLTYLLSP